jgi:general secretion pathway protein A
MDRFNFLTPPFTREIRAEHRFKPDFFEAEIKSLREMAECRQSAALIGPAGSGKSVVLRALVATLPEARYRTVYLKHSNLGARDMCRQIAIGLGLPSVGSFPSLVRVLEERLYTGFLSHGLRQVLIFDDAHELRIEALRLLRVLTNFEMDSKLVVSVFLAGQAPLKKMLMTTDLEDVRHRLSACGDLRLLSREETIAYINHRVKLAGAATSPFSSDACEAIFEISQGNMRAVDKIAQASLRAASQAERATISASDVASARSTQWM